MKGCSLPPWVEASITLRDSRGETVAKSDTRKLAPVSSQPAHFDTNHVNYSQEVAQLSRAFTTDRAVYLVGHVPRPTINSRLSASWPFQWSAFSKMDSRWSTCWLYACRVIIAKAREFNGGCPLIWVKFPFDSVNRGQRATFGNFCVECVSVYAQLLVIARVIIQWNIFCFILHSSLQLYGY